MHALLSQLSLPSIEMGKTSVAKSEQSAQAGTRETTAVMLASFQHIFDADAETQRIVDVPVEDIVRDDEVAGEKAEVSALSKGPKDADHRGLDIADLETAVVHPVDTDQKRRDLTDLEPMQNTPKTVPVAENLADPQPDIVDSSKVRTPDSAGTPFDQSSQASAGALPLYRSERLFTPATDAEHSPSQRPSTVSMNVPHHFGWTIMPKQVEPIMAKPAHLATADADMPHTQQLRTSETNFGDMKTISPPDVGSNSAAKSMSLAPGQKVPFLPPLTQKTAGTEFQLLPHAPQSAIATPPQQPQTPDTTTRMSLRNSHLEIEKSKPNERLPHDRLRTPPIGFSVTTPAQNNAPLFAGRSAGVMLPTHDQSSKFASPVSEPSLFSTVETGPLQIAQQGADPMRATLPQHIARQMAEVVQHHPTRPVEITLSPEELGRVRLSVTPSENGIVVNILAERPETLDLLRRHIDQLAQDFKSLGYDNIGFSFAGGDTDTSDNQHDNMTNDTPQGALTDAELDGPTSTQIHLSSEAESGLDLRL